jgi:tetratricopeptide (TPR) repeat protein
LFDEFFSENKNLCLRQYSAGEKGVIMKLACRSNFAFSWAILGLLCIFLACATSYNKLAKDYYEQGQIFYERMEYDRSIDNFTQALEIEPNGPENHKVYFERGRAYFKNRDYEKAIYDYTRALEITPSNETESKFIILEARGYAHLLNKQYKESIIDYSNALKLKPRHSYTKFIYNNRAWDFYNLQEYDKAIDDFTKAISIDSKFASAHYGRGRTWYQKGDLERAMFDAKEALRLSPGVKKYDDFLFDVKSSMKSEKE